MIRRVVQSNTGTCSASASSKCLLLDGSFFYLTKTRVFIPQGEKPHALAATYYHCLLLLSATTNILSFTGTYVLILLTSEADIKEIRWSMMELKQGGVIWIQYIIKHIYTSLLHQCLWERERISLSSLYHYPMTHHSPLTSAGSLVSPFCSLFYWCDDFTRLGRHITHTAMKPEVRDTDGECDLNECIVSWWMHGQGFSFGSELNVNNKEVHKP